VTAFASFDTCAIVTPFRVCKIVDFLFIFLPTAVKCFFLFSIFSSANSLCFMDYKKARKILYLKRGERTKFMHNRDSV
jgi:hypothetical protein